MSIGGLIQKVAVNLVFANKEKLFALALEKLNKEYINNRQSIAQAIVDKLPGDWHDTATPEEVGNLVDIIKNFIQDVFVAIQAMRSAPVPRPSSRGDAKI